MSSRHGSGRPPVPRTVDSCLAPRCTLLLVLVAFPALAQVQRGVGLPLKGRQQETGAPAAVEPVRKLPRKPAAVALPTADDVAANLNDFIEQQRRNAPPREQSDDRLRPLVFGSAAALPATPEEADYAPRLEPKAPPIGAVKVVEGYAGPAEVFRSRWIRIPGLPWRRYGDNSLDALYAQSRLWDPFNQSILKGDFPLHGRRNFFTFTGISETTFETKRLPIGSGASAADPGEYTFFGRGEIGLVQQNFR